MFKSVTLCWEAIPLFVAETFSRFDSFSLWVEARVSVRDKFSLLLGTSPEDFSILWRQVLPGLEIISLCVGRRLPLFKRISLVMAETISRFDSFSLWLETGRSVRDNFSLCQRQALVGGFLFLLETSPLQFLSVVGGKGLCPR